MRLSEVTSSILDLYGFEPYKEEINEIIENLLVSKRVYQDANNIIYLSDSEIQSFLELELRLKDKEKARFQNFRNFILDTLGATIDIHQLKLLWATFVEYLYNNFYEFGEDALSKLHPHHKSRIPINGEDTFLHIANSSLKDKNLCSLFKLTVEKFPDYASSDDLDFLNDLAQKTLCFASLGMDPKLAESTLDWKLVDWVLYLDTNVLYSILNLHTHPENEACKALIHLINENKPQINIKLRYSELTKKELNAKNSDFKLIDETLSDSSIRAMLKSNNLDDFSKKYYENLLVNRKETLHPSKIVDIAPRTLLHHQIDISRNQKRIEKMGEDYLNIRIQHYRRYIEELNQTRTEFNRSKKSNIRLIEKNDKQITHDITLREIILDQRSSVMKESEITSLNSVKYFGITLDALFLKYDKQEIKDYNDQRSYPVFFRPSFLLNKLVKVLPIRTLDYKKAFIKAVTSKGFNRDVQKSHDIIKIVSYLRSQGIDNEEVVYNIISEELFLEKYKSSKNSNDFNQGEFIEAELNKELSKKEAELLKTRKELELKEEEATEKTEKTKELEQKKSSIENELSLYKKALISLQSTVEKLEKRPTNYQNQQKIDFDAENQRSVARKYKRSLIDEVESRIDDYKNSNFRIWQRKIWWNLFWVIPFTIVMLIIILFPPDINSLTMDPISIRIILSLFLLILDGVFLLLVRLRYWDEGNKQKRFENISIPNDLRRKLKELNSEEE